MSIVKDTQAYEDWLRLHCDVDEHGLRKKHNRMSDDPFMFFRATCYRFARKIKKLHGHLAAARHVPSVGDAHIENWGTWRDSEGRFVWGVNDFDDAALLPYPYDLLRLATSAQLSGQVRGSDKDQAEAILRGYRKGLSDPKPRFIDIDKTWMKELVRRPSASPSEFERRLGEGKPVEPPQDVIEALLYQLPAGSSAVRYSKQQRGGGSLGRRRYVAAGFWRGGRVVREAKALVPSSWDWANGVGDAASLFLNVATGRFRSPDPHLSLCSGYIVRRIAPDSQKLDTADALVKHESLVWLAAMGRDLAAIHLSGSATRDKLADDLKGRGDDWLAEGAQKAIEQVREDYRVWCEYHPKKDKGK